MPSFYAPAAVAIVFDMIGQIPPMSEHHLLYQIEWLRKHACQVINCLNCYPIRCKRVIVYIST